MIQLSIVLINYNSTSYTIDCIDSIVEVIGDKLNYEIFVVDNKSENIEVSKLKDYLFFKSYKHVYFIESDANLGFSGGNMLGAKHANGDFLVFVNNDTLFHEDTFTKMYEFMVQNKNIGVSTCLSKDKNGKNHIRKKSKLIEWYLKSNSASRNVLLRRKLTVVIHFTT